MPHAGQVQRKSMKSNRVKRFGKLSKEKKKSCHRLVKQKWDFDCENTPCSYTHTHNPLCFHFQVRLFNGETNPEIPFWNKSAERTWYFSAKAQGDPDLKGSWSKGNCLRKQNQGLKQAAVCHDRQTNHHLSSHWNATNKTKLQQFELIFMSPLVRGLFELLYTSQPNPNQTIQNNKSGSQSRDGKNELLRFVWQRMFHLISFVK